MPFCFYGVVEMEWKLLTEESGSKPNSREETSAANVPGGVIVRTTILALQSTPAVSTSLVFIPGDIEVRRDLGSNKILPKVKRPLDPEPC
jgi:hypothetical protein